MTTSLVSSVALGIVSRKQDVFQVTLAFVEGMIKKVFMPVLTKFGEK